MGLQVSLKGWPGAPTKRPNTKCPSPKTSQIQNDPKLSCSDPDMDPDLALVSDPDSDSKCLLKIHLNRR